MPVACFKLMKFCFSGYRDFYVFCFPNCNRGTLIYILKVITSQDISAQYLLFQSWS